MADDPADLFEVANAMFSVTLTLFSGLISQGAVDRGKLAGHIAGELNRLRRSYCNRTYGFLLQEVGKALSEAGKPDQPDWLRAVVQGGKPRDD